MMSQKRESIRRIGYTVELIQAQQERNPGYMQIMLDRIIRAELEHLEIETGISLDDIANDWRFVLAQEGK